MQTKINKITYMDCLRGFDKDISHLVIYQESSDFL